MIFNCVPPAEKATEYILSHLGKYIVSQQTPYLFLFRVWFKDHVIFNRAVSIIHNPSIIKPEDEKDKVYEISYKYKLTGEIVSCPLYKTSRGVFREVYLDILGLNKEYRLDLKSSSSDDAGFTIEILGIRDYTEEIKPTWLGRYSFDIDKSFKEYWDGVKVIESIGEYLHGDWRLPLHDDDDIPYKMTDEEEKREKMKRIKMRQKRENKKENGNRWMRNN